MTGIVLIRDGHLDIFPQNMLSAVANIVPTSD